MTDYGSPPPPEPEEGSARWLADAIQTVRIPATIMQWYAIGSMVLAALVVTVFLAAPDAICEPWYERVVKKNQERPAGERETLPSYRQFVQGQQIQWVGGGAISLVCSFVIAFGAVRMRYLNGYGWAVTAAVLSAIPCTNSCCCIGMPVGIWSIVILFGSDVRLAFARVGSAGGLEAFGDIRAPREESPSRPIRLE